MKGEMGELWQRAKGNVNGNRSDKTAAAYRPFKRAQGMARGGLATKSTPAAEGKDPLLKR